MARPLSPRARGLTAGAITAALVVAVALLQRSPALRRHARAFERRVTRGHPHFVEHVVADHFQRGNVHTHSTRSDGTAPIEAMAGWYRDHGYQFVAMTEHNLRVDPADLGALTGPSFVVIPGEEVTDFSGGKPLHVNALCGKWTVKGGGDFGRADLGLAVILGQIRASGGIPLVNHPNFHWTLTAPEIERGTSGRYLLEIWSGHPDVSPMGDALHPSGEAIWDELLARGGDVIPVAVDDAHGLPGDPKGGDALPGRAWVETFGDETTSSAICGALAEGRLYASNGPVLARIAVEGETLAVATSDPDATVELVGELGEVLRRVRASEVAERAGLREISYRLEGGETLVRARVTDAAGRRAWTKSYRVEP